MPKISEFLEVATTDVTSVVPIVEVGSTNRNKIISLTNLKTQLFAPATTSVLGVVKVGTSLTINGAGLLDVATPLPSQTGNANKFLKTDGAGSLTWSTVAGANTGNFIFAANDASLPLGSDMTLSTYQSGGNKESKLTLSTSTISSIDVGNNFRIRNGNGTGFEHDWLFDAVGTLTAPGRIITPAVEGANDELNIYSNWAKDTGISIYSVTDLESVTLTSDRIVAVVTNVGPSQKQWFFEESGNFKLPAGGDIVDSTGVSVLGGSGSSSVTTGETAPVGPSLGDLWYDTISGRTYIYYDSNWVDANPVDGNLTLAETFTLVPGEAPVSPSEGTLAVADGVLWDPAADGTRQLTIYLNGVWNIVSLLPVVTP